MAIRKAFEEKGVKLLHDSYTNQQFFVLPDEWHEALSKDFAMTHMGKPTRPTPPCASAPAGPPRPRMWRR